MDKFADEETVKLMIDFNKWLMTNDPAPKSVAEIRLYWETKRKELADRIVTHYNKELEKIMER